MAKSNNSKFILSASLAACIALPTAMISAPSYANESYTHYISDRIEVPMRRGAGGEFRIERMIPTGTPLKILETSGSWSRVELELNNRTWTGWVHQVAIQNQPPARFLVRDQAERLERLDTRFKSLQAEHEQLSEQYQAASSELEQLKQERFEMEQEFQHIKDVSGNTLEIERQNQELRQTLSELETQNVIMREQIAKSEDTIKRQWFLTGAGVLLLGLLIGRFFRMPQRRGSWDKI